MIEGPVSASCPATILQFHEQAMVIVDEAAAPLPNRKAYFEEVYAGKPNWQRWE